MRRTFSGVGEANELLGRVGREDRDAFAALYELTAARIFGVCLRIVRDRDRARDVFQDAFVKIWANASRYDAAKGDALVWMTIVARRCALDDVRRHARAPLADSTLVDEMMDGTRRPDLATDAAVWSCLGRLDRSCQHAILLAFVDGLTHSELAERLARPLGTVKSWLRRGLEQLRACLDA